MNAPTIDTLTTALRAFINSRPGFEPANYAGAPDAYRADYRTAYRDLQDARELLRHVERSSMTADTLLREGLTRRLTIFSWPDGRVRLDYTPGQYYPTEYRAAACRALADALWAHYRESSSTGDSLRRTMRSLLGARLANRWFS